MYDNFVKIVQEKGLTAYRVAKDTGISPTVFSDWKSGKSSPKIDKIKKIADYLNVSEDYLMGNTDNPQPIDEQLSGVDFALYGEVKEMIEEEKQDVLDYIRYKKLKKKNS